MILQRRIFLPRQELGLPCKEAAPAKRCAMPAVGFAMLFSAAPWHSSTVCGRPVSLMAWLGSAADPARAT